MPDHRQGAGILQQQLSAHNRPSPQLPRGFTRHDAIPALLTLAAMVIGARIFLFFLFPYALQVGFDEGYEAAAVERIIDGHWLPYVDCFSHRGPFLYWTLAVFHLLVGRFEYTGTRVMGLVCSLTTTATIFLGGWSAGWPMAGAIAAALNVFVVAVLYVPGGGVGVHCEPVAVAYATAAFFLVAYGLCRARSPRARTVLLAVGGVLVGTAGLTKQTMAVASMPMILWIIARSLQGPECPVSDRLRGWRALLNVIPFVAGGLGLVAAVLARYAIAGQLRAFFFWSTTFNTKVYMEPYKGRILASLSDWFFDQPFAIMGVALALIMVMARPLSLAECFTLRGLVRGLLGAAFEVTIGLMALLLLFAAAGPLRFWPHYFVPVYPIFGLLLGVYIERGLRRSGAVPLLAQAAVAVVVGALLILSGSNKLSALREERAHGGWPDPRPDPACAEIDRIAGPGQGPIFVWGTAGDIYVTCRRRSASKFANTTAVAGIVPPFWDQPRAAREVPGGKAELARELTAARPPVIIDTPISPGVAMMDSPVLAAVANQHYCRLSNLRDNSGRDLVFFARKDLPACTKRTP
ncbi:MAG: hypothetical protein ACLP66_09120 [Polyangia bacterium]